MTSMEDMNLRDFVYLDVERVKSLLAQLERGLLNDRSDSVGSSKSLEGRAGVNIPALVDIGGAGQYVTTDQSTETRTLHDFVYNQTEERLLELDRLKILPNDFTSDHLRSNDVRAGLSPVEYVLIRGKVEISDYQYMMTLLSNINDISRILTEFTYQGRLDAASGKAKAVLNQEVQKAVAENKMDDRYVSNLMKILNIFVKDRLIIKSMPFADDPNIRIVGPLQAFHLRDSLNDIRFKFGSSPSVEWTVFGQIAAVPPKNELRTQPSLVFSNDIEGAMNTVFDSLRGIEDQFRVTYPEIAITPIAVYRD